MRVAPHPNTSKVALALTMKEAPIRGHTSLTPAIIIAMKELELELLLDLLPPDHPYQETIVDVLTEKAIGESDLDALLADSSANFDTVAL